MKDEIRPPPDDELERADALLDQADALLRRHRGSAPRTPAPQSEFRESETRLEHFALEDDDDLPILTDIVDDLELADVASGPRIETVGFVAPAFDDIATGNPPAFAGEALHFPASPEARFAAAPEDAAAPIETSSPGEAAVGMPETRSASEAADAPSPAHAEALQEDTAPASITLVAPPPAAPSLPPPAARIEPPALSPADEQALLVSARAALIEELVELDTEIARAVDSWLEGELPQIVTRELDSLAERIRTETLAQMRATLLPTLSERIAQRIDKLVD